MSGGTFWGIVTVVGAVCSVLGLVVGWHFGKKSAASAASSAEANARTAAAPEERVAAEAAARRVAMRPEVFGHRASISGGGNIEVCVENLSVNVARNIDVFLFQGGELKGHQRVISHLSKGETWEKDLKPPGTRGFQPRGVEYSVMCEFTGPDDHRWRSTRVSGVGFENCPLEFESLT